MKKFVILLGLVLVIPLVLAACGGGGASGGTTVKTVMTDFKFDPAEWGVPAGQSVTRDLTNNGSVEHSWAVMSKPVTGPSFTDADKANVLFTKVLPAGGAEKTTFTSPTSPGEYQVICDIPGHYEAGMVGKLTVQ